MKPSVKICSVLFALLLTAGVKAAVSPSEAESEKSKTYSKSYAVGNGDKISLDNSFGEMKISTWNKNEVKVDVSITVKASTDAYAQKLLDVISIEDGKNGSDIFFKTHMKNENRSRDDDDGKGRNTSMKINYTVYLPATVTLDAENNFGPLSIGDFDGAASLTSKFGSLVAGKLSQPKKIRVEFGKATVESMKGGKIDIRFSRAQFNKLSGDITADFEQSHGVKLNLDNNLTKIDLKVNFSQLYLDAEKNLSASFSINNSFGSFKNQTDFPITRQKEDEDRYFNKNQRYSGKAGSGTLPVEIRNNFGTVTLGHDLSFDVNEKSKGAEKSARKNKA